MNTGIITSFVVSGILLLAILAMNLNISHSSTGLTMRQINQEQANSIAELLSYDFPKIGYNEYSVINNPISIADSNRIKFESNLNKSGTPETVTWFFDDSGTTPADNILSRTVDGNKTEIAVGVAEFKLIYYDGDMQKINTPLGTQSRRNDVRHIKVVMIVSSKQKLGKIRSSDGEYVISPWQRTYSPKNLSF